jgi:hypothetical protein
MPRPRYKYQVFVSSTFADLHEERQAVTWEILKLRHIPAGMENFPATDDRGWKIIERTIDDSDYYVLLVAGRYGSVDPATGISWTEREYEYARAKGIPVLAFVREAGSITGDKMDTGAKAEQLARLTNKLRDTHLYSTWTTKEDLTGKVMAALVRAIADADDENRAPPGWIRGDLSSADALGELARLSKENADLRSEILALGGSKKAVLELRIDGQRPTGQREVAISAYEIDQLRSSNKFNAQQMAERVSRTFWINATLHNLGTAVARNIKVTFRVNTRVDAVDLNRAERNYRFPIPSSAPWYLNPSQPVHVSGNSTKRDYAVVEQRVTTLGVRSQEPLVRVGFVLPEGAVPELGVIEFTVEYYAISEEGQQVTGEIAVKVRRGDPLVVSAEELAEDF